MVAIEQAAAGLIINAIPLKCPIPECSQPLSDHNVAAVVPASEGVDTKFAGLWEKYQRQMLLRALQARNVDAKQPEDHEIVLTCGQCNEYIEVFQPPAPGFFKSVQLRLIASISELEAKEVEESILKKHTLENKKKERISYVTRESQRQFDEHFQMRLQAEFDVEWKEELKRKMVDYKEQLAELEEKNEKIRVLMRAPPTAFTEDESKEYEMLKALKKKNKDQKTRFNQLTKQFNDFAFSAIHEDELKTKKTKSKKLPKIVSPEEFVESKIKSYKSKMRRTLESQLRNNPEMIGLRENLRRELNENLQRIENDFEGELKEFDENIVHSLKRRREELRSHAEWQKIALSYRNSERLQRKIKLGEDVKCETLEVSETNKYFVCKKVECSGAYCLACNSHLSKDQLETHFCALEPIDELHAQVLDTLARASARACANCGFPGMKDLACTHMTCERCKTRWCYHCGKSESSVQSFSSHNEWNVNTPEGAGKCPMYLHYKYGDVDNGGGQRDGDPALALKKFHLILQKEAIDQLQKTVDERLWNQMMNLHFPQGIF
eukprot:TRINITY_DN3716_c0_g1_i1.p1 TRINITY_DN3716_c0_g1~~TRINITY_DN3716_c0_g1_i1.p1  ORF type:complete len:622 (+),score=174.53 TRINITY_DN3716_c0_g1_i1:214-1866(+)